MLTFTPSKIRTTLNSIYMSTTAFINFFGNMQVTIMELLGMLDTTDAAAVQAVFQSIYDAVETINVSFVFKAIEPVE